MEKKRETTMDFAANIEKVREVSSNLSKLKGVSIFSHFSAGGTGAP